MGSLGNQNIQVLSKQIIKPSSSSSLSSTSNQHFERLNLSFLDQIAPPTYVLLIFFYEASSHEPKFCSDRSQVSSKLKHSLADTLTEFRPLAGRINVEGSYVDCNDAGVEYIEVRVHKPMLHVIRDNRNIEDELKIYVRAEPYFNNILSEIPLAIQTNFFDCGGVAIGVCIAHKVADMESLVSFMNAWAAKCRGDESPKPIFDISGRFPQVNLSEFYAKFAPPPQPQGLETTTKFVTKRFVLDKQKLEALTHDGVVEKLSKHPTKVEAVTAFIWRLYMRASMEKNKTFVALHAVNFRKRATPQLPEGYFGNAVTQAMTLFKPEEAVEEEEVCTKLVSKLRNAVKEVDRGYVDKVENGHLEYLCKLVDTSLHKGDSVLDVLMFSSWRRFPMYKVDYGWGKPVWVSPPGPPAETKNLVVLMDTKCGDGMEVWVTVDEESMAVIEKNYNLF